MSFDRIADVYSLLERLRFADALQKARTFALGKITEPKRALIVGEGDGRFLEQLVRVHPTVEIDCIDESARMLELARKRIAQRVPQCLSRIHFIQRDVCDGLPDGGGYDLIVTHFFLDCFNADKLTEVVNAVAAAAQQNSVWLLADFAVPDRGWRRWNAKLWVALMYRFFRLTTGIRASQLINPAPLLRGRGFDLVARKQWRAGMVKSEIWRRGS